MDGYLNDDSDSTNQETEEEWWSNQVLNFTITSRYLHFFDLYLF